tara:strand:+ start:432 stop:779 length:348 start_codon:yes stop_codon:yes gene_type:complete
MISTNNLLKNFEQSKSFLQSQNNESIISVYWQERYSKRIYNPEFLENFRSRDHNNEGLTRDLDDSGVNFNFEDFANLEKLLVMTSFSIISKIIILVNLILLIYIEIKELITIVLL